MNTSKPNPFRERTHARAIRVDALDLMLMQRGDQTSPPADNPPTPEQTLRAIKASAGVVKSMRPLTAAELRCAAASVHIPAAARRPMLARVMHALRAGARAAAAAWRA